MPKSRLTFVSASVLALFLVGLSPIPALLAASSTGGSGPGPALNSVQVTIQTGSITNASSFDLDAYNSTGALVASYTGQYPKVALDLPSGTYLLAATASSATAGGSPVCCVCAGSGASGSAPSVPSPQTTTASSAGAVIGYPCIPANPPVEYGYSLVQVTGATTLTIATQSPSSIPTAKVSVTVDFKNGTAASGAYVSANVVGADWYWDYQNLNMSAQTSPNGVAQLIVPAVPLAVTASDDVQINLPKNQTTIQVEVGGQTVNVTVYYSPNYVYLTSSALLVPPQTSLSMVLTAQAQPIRIPYAVSEEAPGDAVANAATPTSSPAIASGSEAAVASASTTSSATPATTSIPPIPSSIVATQAPAATADGSWGASLMTLGVLALAGVLAALAGIGISRGRR